MLAVFVIGVFVPGPARSEVHRLIVVEEAAPRSLGRTMVGAIAEYVVLPGETFETIGVRFGVDPTAIARRNTRWVHAALVPGTKLSIDVHRTVPSSSFGPAGGILINVAQKLLFLLVQDGSVMTMPVAVGRSDWPTPTGVFHVARKELDPTWDVPLSIQQEMRRLGRPVVTRIPPGPQNPLGRYWIGLSLPNLGIHGTNAPSSVPGYTTHGCLRVASEQIQILFDRVAVGTAGEIIYEPTLLTWYKGRFFLEAHPDVYGRRAKAVQTLHAAAEQLGVQGSIDWSLVEEVVQRREGLAVDVTLR
jgi:L,D-transpeptidase ErfK/SrfK